MVRWGRFAKYNVCDGNGRVCQFRKISARILDDRINTLRQVSNSKGPYDRYRPERGRNELGGWRNAVLNHLLRYSRKHDENDERGRIALEQSVQNLRSRSL